MRFTRLRLNGFKSFVDPTELVIAEGLTGVVGPNGCGKSNLLEALRWVMGENRPSAMRGGGMEDVIFAGAATRPARNFAEVSLAIDNTDRLAPAGFNDRDTLDIVRRITRDAGSAYKTNGKDVRARDVQMLFADASTGAHSPALVRQGQISELINARPKARRRILEEAAGISGLYQRRHEAELKLRQTETNLTRVDDVLEQLAAQLAQLARQARQAARYREIGTALRHAEGLLLYRRWREAADEMAAAAAAMTERTTLAARGEAAARAAEKHREEAEAALPPLREEEAIASALLQRLEVERDTLGQEESRAAEAIERLTGRIAQLANDAEREGALNSDAGETIAGLEAEAAELAEAGSGHEARMDAAMQEATEAATLLQEREALLSAATEEVARLAARHQSARRLHDDSATTLERTENEARKVQAGMEAARAALDEAGARFEAATEAQARAAAEAEAAEAAAQAAEEARSSAQSAEADARANRSSAEGEAGALAAEKAALARLVERESNEDAMLLDRMRVDPGFEKALGAALADDLRAPEVGQADASGWVTLPNYNELQSLPRGVVPLSRHVRGPGVLSRRMGQIGLVDAAEGARLQPELKPGQRLVSVEGDLWRWDGLRAGAEDAPTAAALRLQQLNRLEALKQDLEAANARAEGTRRAHQTLVAELEASGEADRQARAARREADQAVATANRDLSRAEADRNIAAGQLENLSLAAGRHEQELAAARSRLAEAQVAAANLGDLDAARAEVEELKLTVEAARVTMLSKRSAHDELRRGGEARERRAEAVERELTGWRSRLRTASDRIAELNSRRTEAEAELETARAIPGTLTERREKLAAALDEAGSRRARAADALSAGESTLRQAIQAEREAERLAADAREARAGAAARAEALRDAQAAAVERIREEQECDPEELLAALDIDPANMPAVATIEADVLRHRRQRDALGSVNLRAEEDAREVQEEHDTLAAEKIDLEEAIKKLRQGIASLNKEGRERLLTAFEEVNRNFGTLFTLLFNGGEARLVLVESDDPLEAGLEIMCQPPGKKLSTLSLLSGGEQTLTAMALIFAVFIANPAPICVLDEVDAPLDDANVTRFCGLLDEMTRRTDTRFLIITHHAITMSRMDRLFGVTMAEQGVSQLVSVDLKKAASMVA
ncbi:chromosome segregation protein SMC [Brevirhabdus pacifica]|uniref:Chromosome partition protein Smc n=2 Tax=Brevirhabdus pacifica TaxID=1267768 RepID=A0A1U7DJ85_9RHOB|nr:chromosome segregation protein SMC [Brevirhabdus pacifica]APX90067.1 chromosome segregation protein SMC [Brevirhabdus pacifica]OWU75341.1 chromosome segregation protein SMC [Loktanella sp. 22II-4b]PJJ82681.1 condensin subunit Smc [Brevirhabdus pacifica]